MATVHLARDLKHDRPVALKVLHHAAAGQLNQALDHLEQAVEAGWPDVALLDHESEFQRYRDEPGLRELRARVKALPKVPVSPAIAQLGVR
jgi:hypothetical protein